MSSVLTENIVLAKTRNQDLRNVKKLNCWGSELSDISIIRRLPNVQVLSLSINKISTLADFACCKQLQELYLRGNQIKDINEILYLIELSDLRKLWLAENPCADFENYRMTVLKALPNLEYLDNVKVSQDEVRRADMEGNDLVWPGDEEENFDEQAENTLNQQDQSHASNHSNTNPHANQSHSVSQITSPSQPVHDTSSSNSQYTHVQTSNYSPPIDYVQSNYSHINQQACPGSGSSSASSTSQRGSISGNGNSSTHNQISKSKSISDYNLYNGSSNMVNPNLSATGYDPTTASPMLLQYYGDVSSTSTASGYQASPAVHLNNSNLPGNASSLRSASASSSQSQGQRLLPKGGRNRNANILSAVLCLIKELDYASLEVVDTTIHCRMEEMED